MRDSRSTRWLPYCLTFVLLAGTVGLFTAPSAVAATGMKQTFVTLASETGDYLGDGQARQFTPDNATITAALLSKQADGVQVKVAAAGGAWQMLFAAPSGVALATGTYLGAQPISSRDPGRAGIEIAGESRGCSDAAGQFTVRDFAYTGTEVTKLSLTYELHCERSDAPALFGEVVINKSAPIAPAEISPWHIDWPTTYATLTGRAVPVRITAGPAGSFQVTDVGITSREQPVGSVGAFTIDSDSCTGVSLPPGGQCRVLVRFTPDLLGAYDASLNINGDTNTTVKLSGQTFTGTTRWQQVVSDSAGSLTQATTVDPVAGDHLIATGDPNSVYVSGQTEGRSLATWFLAPAGEELTPGKTYVAARQATSSDTSRARFTLEGGSAPCNRSYASFHIEEIEFDAGTGELAHFSATYQHNCGSALADSSNLGSIAYRADGGIQPVPAFGELSGLKRTWLSQQIQPAVTEYGSTVTVSGTLHAADSVALAGQRISLLQRLAGDDSWRKVDEATTAANGGYSFTRIAKLSGKVYVSFGGNNDYLGSTADPVALTVKRMVVIKLSDPKVRVDERTRLHGYIAPHAWRVDIAAQFRNRQGVWRTFIVDRTDDTGRFSWKIKSSAAGTFPIRVITEAKGGLAEGISNHVVLTVA